MNICKIHEFGPLIVNDSPKWRTRKCLKCGYIDIVMKPLDFSNSTLFHSDIKPVEIGDFINNDEVSGKIWWQGARHSSDSIEEERRRIPISKIDK